MCRSRQIMVMVALDCREIAIFACDSMPSLRVETSHLTLLRSFVV